MKATSMPALIFYKSRSYQQILGASIMTKVLTIRMLLLFVNTHNEYNKTVSITAAKKGEYL
jgi:hypothetical protein